MKPIRLSRHAQGYFASRGFTEQEVIHAINEANWEIGESGKLECKRIFHLMQNGIRNSTI